MEPDRLKLNNSNILSNLEKLGLSPKESEIYLYVFQNQNKAIAEITRILKIPRTTVIETIDKLMKKGLVFYSYKGKQKIVVAESSEKLEILLNEREINLQRENKQLDEIRKLLPEMLSQLVNIETVEAKVPGAKIRHYQGIEAVERIYFQEVYKCSELHCYANAPWITRELPRVSEKLATRLSQNKLTYHTLFTKAFPPEFETFSNLVMKYPNFKYKFLPFDENLFEIDYTLYDGKIAIFYKDHEPSVVILESKILYLHALSLFNLLWNLL